MLSLEGLLVYPHIFNVKVKEIKLKNIMSPAEFGVNEFESLSQDGPNRCHVDEHYRNSHESVDHGHNLAHRSFRDKISIS